MSTLSLHRVRQLLLVPAVLIGFLAASPLFARIIIAPPRFAVKVDHKSPPRTLLPPAPDAAPIPSPWLVKDLAKVPLIQLQPPTLVPNDWQARHDLETASSSRGERGDRPLEEVRNQEDMKTVELIARINFLNKKSPDHFLELLCSQRPDLAGLPWMMGDACRMDRETSKLFLIKVQLVREALIVEETARTRLGPNNTGEAFWARFDRPDREMKVASSKGLTASARSAALMQILATEPAPVRIGLVERLARFNHPDTNRSLTRLAVFSFEKELRQAALDALTRKPAQVAPDVLLTGLRYPWPDIARNAADAIAALKRQDLIPQLIDALDQPDPRAPVVQEAGGAKTLAVREVVRLNHHRSCLLCHAPGNSDDISMDRFGRTRDILTAPVPNPYDHLPGPSFGYGESSPDLAIRTDVTYLRQDFSLLQKVEQHGPWPKEQRFDFLVRIRPVDTKEAEDYGAWVKEQGPSYRPPHQQAALVALRALTGKDASAPTAQAWQALLEKK